MTAIPEDIREKVSAALRLVKATHYLDEKIDIVARLLLSERNATRNATLEEAAKIAENNDYFVSEGEFIATAIRKEKT
ncbi:MAG: hypothetical protein WC100_22230 [Sterolibacterium sp.]